MASSLAKLLLPLALFFSASLSVAAYATALDATNEDARNQEGQSPPDGRRRRRNKGTAGTSSSRRRKKGKRPHPLIMQRFNELEARVKELEDLVASLMGNGGVPPTAPPTERPTPRPIRTTTTPPPATTRPRPTTTPWPWHTTDPPDAPNYGEPIRGDFGAYECPPGSTRILSQKQCMAAADFFGSKWAQGSASSTLPKGCIEWSGRFWWNQAGWKRPCAKRVKPICESHDHDTTPTAPPTAKPKPDREACEGKETDEWCEFTYEGSETKRIGFCSEPIAESNQGVTSYYWRCQLPSSRPGMDDVDDKVLACRNERPGSNCVFTSYHSWRCGEHGGRNGDGENDDDEADRHAPHRRRRSCKVDGQCQEAMIKLPTGNSKMLPTCVPDQTTTRPPITYETPCDKKGRMLGDKCSDQDVGRYKGTCGIIGELVAPTRRRRRRRRPMASCVGGKKSYVYNRATWDQNEARHVCQWEEVGKMCSVTRAKNSALNPDLDLQSDWSMVWGKCEVQTLIDGEVSETYAKVKDLKMSEMLVKTDSAERFMSCKVPEKYQWAGGAPRSPNEIIKELGGRPNNYPNLWP